MSIYINPNVNSTKLSAASELAATFEAPMLAQLMNSWQARLTGLLGATTGKRKPAPGRKWTKYGLDCFIILSALPMLALLFGVISLLIKLDSAGPVFHRRRVLGLGGTPFDAFKFRTMYTNGDEILAQHPQQQAELAATCKIKQDPRVTKIGSFLRQSSLDELPQLLNVLLGQMSLVGPRMISPEEIDNYGDYGDELLTVMPGLTGLWQVSGRSDLSYQERILLDMTYIRQYSLSTDLSILFVRTLPAVVKGQGAY